MLRLIKVETSKKIMYPKEVLYITTTFQAECDCPIDKYAQIFCDLDFGYMTLPEMYNNSYRIKGEFYPQPMHLKKGETITNTIRWNIPDDPYAGTFRMKIGICDSDAVPFTFIVNDKECKRYYVGDIEVVFSECAPKFVYSHNEGQVFEFKKNDIISYEKETDIEIHVRDLENDTVFVEKSKSDYVDFDLLEKDGKITLENVVEKDGYELLSVKMPTLINAKGAKFISTMNGGRLVDSKNTVCMGYERKFEQKNLGILVDGEDYVMLEAPFMDECIHYSVYERNNERYGAVGVTLTYRIRKHGKDRSVKVINTPTANVMRTKELRDILKFVRGDLKRPNDFYDRCIFYYFEIECDGHPEKHTFLQALDRVKMLYNMTGGVKQVVLLRGFQHTGHDTGYPDVFSINKRAGTIEELEYVINEAKKYNATITFHDNYDDLYEELPAYDSSIGALDEYNLPYKGWIWVSGLSRIISVPKYVKSGKMAQRVKKTLEMYPVKDAYHLDVLSCEARRYDLDENVRMAAEEFVEYKRDVIREFKKYGFNMSSEGVSMPFAGVIGHAWNINAGEDKMYPNEKIYPILGMIFHSILPYSCCGGELSILSGSELVPNIPGDPSEYYKEKFYLFTLPMGLLYDETIDGYEENVVTYSDGTTLKYIDGEIEIKTKDGKYYTKDGNTLAPGFRDNEYLGYTRSGEFIFEIPDIKISKIIEIDFEGEKQELSYEIKDNKLIINTRTDTAFKIVLN